MLNCFFSANSYVLSLPAFTIKKYVQDSKIRKGKLLFKKLRSREEFKKATLELIGTSSLNRILRKVGGGRKRNLLLKTTPGTEVAQWVEFMHCMQEVRVWPPSTL